ncbi:MAG: NAD(P)-dependent oxidoreductase [Caballeronia sp.]|jgi:dTDP-4-dehydrorhamnose reductase|uniref:dTDP-4-dehydrorhamnose reductase family protein n=1 Tax=Caballeronia sp. TaxID=1931223 RepID=UPI0026392689|nr:SDR family oxidoreductase [Caballeronia sp.]MDB5837130.1 NAD(P)-dependent oxidoreductase [Caballeronia sp.]
MTRGPHFRVALIGASGLLGRAVANELATITRWRVIRTAFRHGDANSITLDIRDEGAVRHFVTDQAPDAIILAAAERRPDVCENDPMLTRALNVDALRYIASAARELDSWILSISTDYVFDGTEAPYQPDDAPNPLNAYGRSKLEGEQALLQSGARSCVLRLPLLYGPVVDWGESAVTSLAPAIVESARGVAPAVMDAWATRYPTFTPDVAVVIRQLLERHEIGESVTGVMHWSGDEPMTKFDIAQRIAKVLNIDARITAQRTPIDATPRPRDCHLTSDALEVLNIGQRTPFDTAIRTVLQNWPRPTNL